MERIGIRARGSSSCLPEGTTPSGARASNRFPALDPGRTYIDVQDIICRGPARHECTSQVQGHKYRALFACSSPYARVIGIALVRGDIAQGTHFPGDNMCVHNRYSHLASSSHNIQIPTLPASNNAYSFTSRISAAGKRVVMHLWAITPRSNQIRIPNLLRATQRGSLPCTSIPLSWPRALT